MQSEVNVDWVPSESDQSQLTAWNPNRMRRTPTVRRTLLIFTIVGMICSFVGISPTCNIWFQAGVSKFRRKFNQDDCRVLVDLLECKNNCNGFWLISWFNDCLSHQVTVSQSVNHSFSQSVSQSVNHSVGWSGGQSVGRLSNRLTRTGWKTVSMTR